MPRPAPASSPHSIHHWVSRRLGAWLLLSAGVALAVSAWVIHARFESLERWVVERQLERAVRVLRQDLRAMEALAADYARWDDTYRFVADRNPEYPASNFVPSTAENLDLDFALIVTLDDTIVLSVDFRGDDEPLPALAPAYVQAILEHFPPQPAGAVETRDSRLLWLDDAPVLLGRSAITDSAVAAPARGSLVFGRVLGAEQLKRMRDLADVPFLLVRRTGAAARVPTIASEGPYWKASLDLDDAPMRLAIEVPALLTSERRATYSLLALAALLNALLAIAGTRVILFRRVTGRLQHFAELAAQRDRSQNAPPQWPVQGDDELDRLAVALNTMVGELARHQAQLHQLAHYDSLTQLGNRRRLFELLDARLARARAGERRSSALVLIDLDDFKLINDGLGHLAGDLVLAVFAERLLHLLDSGDVAARLGGDEFAVLLDGHDADSTANLIVPLRPKLAAPIDYEGRQIAIGFSIGIAGLRADYTPGDWLRDADMAMYHAKRAGKNRIAKFSESLAEQARQRLRLAEALREAIAEDVLQVRLQPIVDASCGQIVSVEALARWQHDGQWIEPAIFIELAEESSLIIELGRRVLDAACASLARLRAEYPQLTCSVNLSVRQLVDPLLLDDILQALGRQQLPCDAMHLELTEGQLVAHEQELLATLRRLSEHGLALHLDDFGVGHSSLARLHALPIAALKIDRSFIAPLDADGDDRLVRNIIALGTDLDLQVIAEGVETERARDRLLELGCRTMQGFLFARPMTEQELVGWLHAHGPTRPPAP